MSLPIIMLFESHIDLTPTLLLQNLLPELQSEGYNTICKELSSAWSEQDVFNYSEQAVHNGLNGQTYFMLMQIRQSSLAEKDSTTALNKNYLKLYLKI